MARARRTRFLKQLSDDGLNEEIQTTVLRAVQSAEQIASYLANDGASYSKVGVLARQEQGLWSWLIALCREGVRRRLEA